MGINQNVRRNLESAAAENRRASNADGGEETLGLRAQVSPKAPVALRARTLQVGDLVDLESCPFLNEHPTAASEYAEVTEVEHEAEGAVAVTYEGIDTVGYAPDQVLLVAPLQTSPVAPRKLQAGDRVNVASCPHLKDCADVPQAFLVVASVDHSDEEAHGITNVTFEEVGFVAYGKDEPKLQVNRTQPSWEDLKASIRPWNVFEYNDSGISVRDLVKRMKEEESGTGEGLSALANEDWISQQGFEGARCLIKEDGFDADEIQEKFPDQFQELENAVVEKAHYNYSQILPSTLFIRMDGELDMPDMSQWSDEDAIAIQKEFGELAMKHGFTEKEADEVVRNATYGGWGGVGVLASASDVVEAFQKGEKKFSGEPILYIADTWNGSGHYRTQRGSLDLEVESITKSIDFSSGRSDMGSYSLGEVFGTSDWSYR